MGDGLSADEHDMAFIPALCDQLDDVYRRYLTANRAAIDGDTRQALERSLQLLVAAEGGVREIWLQARVGRAIRQTNEILETYAGPEPPGQTALRSIPTADQPASVRPDTRPARRRLRILVAALVVALAGAVTAAAIFYSDLRHTRHDDHVARQQAAAATRLLAGVQASLAGANLDASGTQTALTRAEAQVSQLQSKLSRTEAQLSKASKQSSPDPGLQQSLSAANSQLQHDQAVIQALVACANDDSSVINNQLAGNSIAAAQALQVANAVCQSALSGG